MKKDFYISLIYKKLKGSISPDEAAQLREWEAQSPQNHKEVNSISQAWEESENYDLPFDLDLDKDFAAVQKKIKHGSTSDIASAKVVSMPNKRNRVIPIAAAIAFLLIAAFAIQTFLQQETPWQTITAHNKTEEITLADGTKVWVNQGSTFSYPISFSKTERQVKLEGEAYFEVSKNAKKRFQVLTEQTTVTVLGTAFNVRENKKTASTEVAVNEGKVQVEAQPTKEKVVLSAKEKAIYSHAQKTLKEETDNNLNDLAWQRGVLIFDETQLSEVISAINQFYSVNISIKNKDVLNCSFSGRYKTSTSPEVLAETIAALYGFEVSNKNNSIILEGGSCN